LTQRLLIASICHDVGGTRTVIPVLRAALRRDIAVQSFVAGPSVAVWEQEAPDIPCVVVEDLLSVTEADALLRGAEPAVLLSASGMYNRSEHTFRKAARGLGLPCVAVLDSWLNYRERFERSGEALDWPDAVCAIDERTAQGMRDAGLPADRVVVTGPANLEDSTRLCREAIAESRDAWRQEEGFSADETVVVFFSDPFYLAPDGRLFDGPGGVYDDGGQSLVGYTSTTSLGQLLAELERSCAAAGRTVRVVIKPHPLEWPDALEPFVGNASHPHVRADLRLHGNPRRWIAVSDLVAGMMSIALLEAALVGRPALSMEIGLKESGAEEPCLSNELGYTRGIFNRDALREAARAIASGTPGSLVTAPVESLHLEGAAGRILDVLVAKSAVAA